MALYSRVPLSSKEKLAISIIGLFSLISWLMPGVGTAYAKAAGQEQSQNFEINLSKISLADLEKQKVPYIEFAKINKEVSLVRSYLEAKNSPLSTYTEYLLSQDDWKTIIAISNAESGMGKHCYVNNCSGIFGAKGLRTYNTVPEWIVDMQSLINKRYKGMTLDQMNGVYVQPRSPSWFQASSAIYQDLSNIEKNFTVES